MAERNRSVDHVTIWQPVLSGMLQNCTGAVAGSFE
jgi:hypothetical protein